MKRSAVFLLVPLLAACNVHSKNPASGDENVSLSADQNGQVAFDFPFAKGSIKLPASMMENGKFDLDGVQLPPGTSTTGFNMNSADRKTVLSMNFITPEAPDAVRSYFVSEFGKKGVEAKVDGDAVIGTSKDGDAFTIKIDPARSGSTGNIVVHSNH